MAVYVVTGKLGAGKTLATVGRIRDALLEGRKVATNLDLRLENLLPPKYGKPKKSDFTSSVYQKIQCYRLPDKPCVDDLEQIGFGTEEVDESRHGLIVLDELGTWLNTRTWADKSRQAVIDWLLHSRKKGWDVYFIIQHTNMIDKQVREGVAEYHASCRRLDRVRIPFIGALLGMIGIKAMMPKIHISTVRYGLERDSIVADRWVYRGKDLYHAYDTRQVFTDAPMSVYSYLPPWHLKGRYMEPSGFKNLLRNINHYFNPSRAPRRPVASKKLPVVTEIMSLPIDERVRAFRDLQTVGVI